MAHPSIDLLGATYPDVPAIDLPSGNSTARFWDVTDTTATASDVAAGTYFHAADGTLTQGTASGGGGGSNWTLLASTEMEVSTTSTSAASAGTVSLGSGAYTKDDIIYVQVRDKEGKKTSCFYGTDAYFVNANKANGSTSTFTTPAVSTIRVNSSNNYVNYTGAYGVWGYSITSAGLLTLRKRYNASYSYTVDSTYTIKVYKLTMPSGVTLF